MKEIFGNKTFVKLFFASVTSQMGSTIGNMAFAFYLLEHFASQPYLATLAELMYSLPTLAVFLVVGVMADRLDRKKIAEYSDWIRAGLTVLLFLSVMSNILWIIFALLFLRSAVSKFFFPAEAGLIQGILTKEQYQTAGGLNQMVFSIFMLFGVGLGAVIYTVLGIYWALVIDGISFIVSGLLIRYCSIHKEARLPNGESNWKELGFKQTLADFSKGGKYILSNKLLLNLLLGFFLFGFINGGFAVLPLFTMKYKLAPDNYEWYASLFALCFGVGIFIGSAISTVVGKKLKPHTMLIGGILITGIATVGMGLSDSIWLYLSFVWLTGFMIAPINVSIAGWIPRIVEPSYMGRVNGWSDPIMMLAQSISLGIIALLFPTVITSVDYIYYGVAALMGIVGVFYWLTLPRLSGLVHEEKPAILEVQA
ncbi:MFS transporter [Bacillus coahuilensis p1.1.43]|uniref:MFS transporter n=1 Tax=Bacillus coahuilensis p1.1.43 TaxID=1150625 RepID=A0A147KBT1_9BACI|nr:MFS transporter [Bacillus coahuilensis]KUP08829.1 MFS transporter [Bacillus coahuilensis p1.1.43]